jgi:hypothetical protein
VDDEFEEEDMMNEMMTGSKKYQESLTEMKRAVHSLGEAVEYVKSDEYETTKDDMMAVATALPAVSLLADADLKENYQNRVAVAALRGDEDEFDEAVESVSDMKSYKQRLLNLMDELPQIAQESKEHYGFDIREEAAKIAESSGRYDADILYTLKTADETLDEFLNGTVYSD